MIWLTYCLIAFAASGVFVVAGWRSRRAKALASARGHYVMPNDVLWNEAEIELPETQADVGAALRLALKRLAAGMARHFIQADIVAPAGLLVPMRGAALADLLEELLAIVCQNAPASRILVTAAAHGERIYIVITDDMPGADADERRAGVKGLMERVAVRGGILDVDVRPAEGTTMTLQLTAVRTDKAGRSITDRTSERVGDPLRPMY